MDPIIDDDFGNRVAARLAATSTYADVERDIVDGILSDVIEAVLAEDRAVSGPSAEGARQPGTPDDEHQWVEIRFYAQVPLRHVVLNVDTVEVVGTLMRSFGFTAIAGLSITTAKPITYIPRDG